MRAFMRKAKTAAAVALLGAGALGAGALLAGGVAPSAEEVRLEEAAASYTAPSYADSYDAEIRAVLSLKEIAGRVWDNWSHDELALYTLAMVLALEGQ